MLDIFKNIQFLGLYLVTNKNCILQILAYSLIKFSLI